MFEGKALIGFVVDNQDPIHKKERELLLPDIEALRMPSRTISDVHAIAREQYTIIVILLYSIKKFLRFLYHPNNCYCRLLFTIKSRTGTSTEARWI